MSFTLLFAVSTLVGLVVVFGLTYMIKGFKTALLAAGAAFVLIAVLFGVIIYVIVNSMSN